MSLLYEIIHHFSIVFLLNFLHFYPKKRHASYERVEQTKTTETLPLFRPCSSEAAPVRICFVANKNEISR